MRCPRWPAAVLLAATMLAAGGAAQAQLFREPGLQALYNADQAAELARTGAQRLAQRPDDAQAVLAVAMAALRANDTGQRQAAIRQARACVQQAPAAPALSVCQYALGTVLGVDAVSQGMVAVARHAGEVRSALTEAHQLDPAWYPARSALVEFYVVAPGLMGGSTRRAQALAAGAPTPAQVAALQARVALADGQTEPALALLARATPGADSALDEDVAQWRAEAGFALLQAGQPAQARALFEPLQRAHPQQAAPAFGLARALIEQGQSAAAVPLLEQAQRLRGAADLPGIDYRLGQALQASGQPERARAALRRFVDSGRAHGKALDDAKQRLAQLGG